MTKKAPQKRICHFIRVTDNIQNMQMQPQITPCQKNLRRALFSMISAFSRSLNTQTRCGYSSVFALLLLAFGGRAVAGTESDSKLESTSSAERPNVIVILSDDQGYGDLSCHDNPVLQTPNLDRLHGESLRFTNFHVSPTCAPSRASLMSGHWNNRTGVWHTILGRSLLRADEPTLGQLFSSAGYNTGLFGKWHLGDNYPFRPEDRGFQEVVRHGGGGIGQTPDGWNNAYFDDTYFHNGVPQRYDGYCADVFFEQARQFIKRSATEKKPFFAWIATPTPHLPFHVAERYRKPYENRQLHPEEEVFFGMLANLDENVGSLREWLKKEGLDQNTIIIFMGDNGSATGDRVHNAGMRGHKGSPYDGGHRVPFFFRWPSRGFDAGHDISALAGAVDIFPTLADLCHLPLPKDYQSDGMSLVPMLRDPGKTPPQRTLITDSQRVLNPVKWKDSCVMDQQWRLIKGKELYNIQNDPGQTTDVSKQHPKQVARLREAYEKWWADISPSFAKDTRIVIGSPKANPVYLNAHDWRCEDGDPPWNQALIRAATTQRGRAQRGYWALQVEVGGTYRITLRRWPHDAQTPISAALPPGAPSPGLEAYRETPGRALNVTTAQLTFAGQTIKKPVPADASGISFEVELPVGPLNLQGDFLGKSEEVIGAFFAEVEKIHPKE